MREKIIFLFILPVLSLLFTVSAQSPTLNIQSFTDIGNNFDKTCYENSCITTIYSYERYFNRNGVWEEIDENWYSCGNSFCTNNYYFNATADNQGTITFYLNNNQLSMQLSNFQNAQLSFNPVLNGSTIIYQDIIPNVDLRYQYLPNKLKEEIVIKQPIANLPQNDFQVSFTKSGNADFVIERPFICDDNLNCQYIEHQINANDISLTIPVNFLNAGIYPVVIDPTLELNSSVNWNGYIDSSNYTRFNNPNTIQLYLNSKRGDIDFDISSISDQATIYNVSLGLFSFV